MIRPERREMSQKPVRKTQVRVAERERHRTRRERNEGLKWQIPFAAAGVLLLLAVAYFFFTTSSQPSQAGNQGVNGPQFHADTQKIDLGDEPLGKTVRAAFNVKNTGVGMLTLTVPQIATVLQGC
jgi:hypothetical protein